jgi:carbon-monoxide dehydrogenase medium subunit
VKPAPFEYLRASSTEEAVDVLRQWDGAARILAGGQSLVPLLNMRLMRPEAIVDVNRVEGLGEISEEGGQVRVGALTRYCSVEWSPVIGARIPLLTEVMRHIGDRQVRSRGTVGGSLAHADPTGELPLAAVALDATVVVDGPESTREVAADEFFEGPYATVLEPAEMITQVRFPARRTVSAFAEHARRHGDFCILSVAAVGEPNGNGGWKSVRLALGGVSERPFVAAEASRLLAGTTLEPEVVAAAGVAAAESAEPTDDIRASADYRLHLIPIYVRRVLEELTRRRHKGAQ